jgi:hypothetical protein
LSGALSSVTFNIVTTGGISASTISATTYYNLPNDVFTTGGTYSDGTTTFTNNTGGTFNTLFNTVTGLTVNGNLIVTGNTNISGETTVGGDVIALGYLRSFNSTGDEGGEIFLNKAQTNTTLSGGVTIDIYQNRIRFFEQGGTARGAFIDLTACIGGASTNLLSGGGGEINTASNLGTGTGLFAQKSAADLQFKSLTSTGGTVTISNDSTTVNLEVVPASNFTGGTVNGATRFTNGLTANTISATTYFNLPTDVRVTGTTYSNNTFTYTNNTGGTFNVLFNTMTGLTVNGGISANTATIVSATTGTSVANLAIESSGRIIKAGGNAIVENYYYSISNSIDTTFYEDDKIILKWDETGNDLKFTMKVEPSGSGDMRSLGVLMGSTTTFNVAIVTPNVEYDLYSAGISAGNRMQAFVTAENDVTYPAYHITAYNTGESFHNTIWVQKIIKI